jgi:hypothetical protein
VTQTSPTDVYIAPLDNPPVESVTDPSGHMLTLPVGFQWAGVALPGGVWLAPQFTLQVRRPETLADLAGLADLGDVVSQRGSGHVQVLAVTRAEVRGYLAWYVEWMPRCHILWASNQDNQVGIGAFKDPDSGFLCRALFAGPILLADLASA